jgi:DNA-binding SARP family transcriptional activator
MLGRFEVTVDGRAVPATEWRRHAAALVKVLALAPGRRLHREQVIDAIWPDDSLEQAVPKLHKAAHFARKATNTANAIELRADVVALFPGTQVTVDVDDFDKYARAALADGNIDAASYALARYGGELVPDDRYEPWAQSRREQLRQRRLELLRLAKRWTDVLELDAADEVAHIALIRLHADAGDRHAALRQFERLVDVLSRELGVSPSLEAQQLRDRLLSATGEPTAARSRSVGCGSGVPEIRTDSASSVLRGQLSAAKHACCETTTYAEVIELARALRATASMLIGDAFSGDLLTTQRELLAAV